jgi:DNA-binding PadR family transcriptional regulator
VLDERDKLNTRGAVTPITLHILLALVGGELHGNGIMREVALSSEGWHVVKPGSFYRALKLALEAGLIADVDARSALTPDDKRRRYYRITDAGRWVAKSEVARMAYLVEIAQTKALWQDES